MFSLLNPLALLGLGLLAIPVIIHLFKPRKVRQLPFSSLRWLRASQHRMSRRIKWHQILLFFLRAAFLLLLVLALAQPILSFGGASAATADRFIILDLSRTMAYHHDGQLDNSPLIETARRLADKVARQGAAGDRTAVILAGASPRVLVPLSADVSSHTAAILAAQPEAAEADLAAALQSIRAMMQANDGARRAVELTFVTDNARQRWSHSGIAAFLAGVNRPVTVRIFDLAPESPRNAWIADATLRASSASRAIHILIGCTADEPQDRTLRLWGIPGLPDLTERVRLEPGRLTQVRFTLPPDFDLAGQVALLALDPADALPDDDRFSINLAPPATAGILVIEPDTARAAHLRPGLHLRAALDAIAATSASGLRITDRSHRNVSVTDIAAADVIFLTDVPTLSEIALDAIRQRVGAGGGLVIFLGPSIDTDFYNQSLYTPDDLSQSLMPARIGNPVRIGGTDAARGRAARLTDIDFTHPILAPLADPAFGDLPDATFSAFFQLEFDPALATRTLALLAGAVPAVTEHRLGDGAVLLLNTTANDLWTDLPRRRSFLPLIDRTLSHLAGGLIHGGFTGGQAVTLPLPDADDNQAVRVTNPDGTTHTTGARPVAGRAVLQLDAAPAPGIYAAEYLARSGEPRAVRFVVQLDRAGSALVHADPAALEAWWTPATVQIIRPDPRNPTAIAGPIKIPLSAWLVGLACALMLAEMLLVHRLCPAVTAASLAGAHALRTPHHEQLTTSN